jgi:hypothetical protein
MKLRFSCFCARPAFVSEAGSEQSTNFRWWDSTNRYKTVREAGSELSTNCRWWDFKLNQYLFYGSVTLLRFCAGSELQPSHLRKRIRMIDGASLLVQPANLWRIKDKK